MEIMEVSVTKDAKKGVGVTRVIDYIIITAYRNVMPKMYSCKWLTGMKLKFILSMLYFTQPYAMLIIFKSS